MSDTRTSRPADPTSRAGYLPGWEGLRAVAATSVLVLHAAAFRLGDRPGLQDFVIQLQAGVQVFFVVSGYVITRPFINAILDQTSLPNVRSYAKHRVFRIFPAYWLALVGAFLMRETYLVTLRDWLVNLSLLQVYSLHEFSRGISIAWTLSVEVSFYVFVPLLFFAVRRVARHVAPLTALVVTIVVVVAVCCVYMQWTVSTGRPLWTFWLPFHLPVFMIGTLMAVVVAVLERRNAAGSLDVVGRLAPVWWIAAVLTLVVAGNRFGTSVLYRAHHLIGMEVLYGLAATFLVLPVAFGFRARGLIGRGLTSRPVIYVGVVSYGIYLWHHQLSVVIASDWFGWTASEGPALLFTLMVFVASLAVASVSWFALEKPVMRWSRRTGVRTHG